MAWLYEPSMYFSWSWYFSGHLHPEHDEGIYAYGLGFELWKFSLRTRVSHPGAMTPFSSQLSIHPDWSWDIYSCQRATSTSTGAPDSARLSDECSSGAEHGIRSHNSLHW